MNCLGIESTAHTFGVGIINEEGKVLANAKDMFTTEKGGMIPKEVAEHHKNVALDIIADALKEADLTIEQIDLISFSQGPGLSPSLLVGRDIAKTLAKDHNIPLVGVNHCVSHLTIGQLVTKAKDPVYLYVSGVNTQVIALAAGKYRIFGETLDVGLGNALDKFARTLGLGFPGGPIIEKMAVDGNYVELPYSVKGMDVSFGGILTKATRMIEDKKATIKDMCFSIQETCFAMLAEVAERAMAHTEKNELLLIGGVGANKRLMHMLETMCEERNAKFYSCPMQYVVDQGVMIAWQGILQQKETLDLETVDIEPYQRTDEIKVSW